MCHILNQSVATSRRYQLTNYSYCAELEQLLSSISHIVIRLKVFPGIQAMQQLQHSTLGCSVNLLSSEAFNILATLGTA